MALWHYERLFYWGLSFEASGMMAPCIVVYDIANEIQKVNGMNVKVFINLEFV